jgi:NTE family protein
MAGLFKKYKIGLVLSGGGARGLAHLGVMKALDEKRIKIDIISAASAGALAAAFYADGYVPEEILELFSSKKIFELIHFTVPRMGFLKVDGIKKLLKDNLKAKNIEDLKIPVFIAVTNFCEGKIEYRSEGNLVDALLASSCVPLLFQVAEIDKIPYIDGGVMDNLPIAPIRKKCRRCIAVHVNPVGRQENIKGLFQIAERAFHLALNSEIIYKKLEVDLFIEPPKLADIGFLDMKKANEIFNLGYEEAIRVIVSHKWFSKKNL